ncbi:uncharacterized protein ATC70_003933 [Mucor velutinosus]|uniref:Uncharacterized protein n=1 Tax=Mucor velutinosus TaxID=708070 RepID=A0AAN7D8L8_9FUNG|nr:hypothetical protein ATC70_003933 [Mucor velutinosus]
MFSLRQKWKSIGQKDIEPAKEDASNSSSISSASGQPSLQQQQSIYQHAPSEVFDIKLEAGGGSAERLRIPANEPSSHVSSTSDHSIAKQPSTKPIDIKYFVPKNIEPEGLSQSVMISDHDYIHRQLVKRYKRNEGHGLTSQHTALYQETIQESSNEDLGYLSTDDEYNEEDSLSVAAAIANSLFSKSAPLLSSMSNYPRYAWSTIALPNQDHNTKNDTFSPLFPIKEDQCSSKAELQLNKDQVEVYMNQDFDANGEKQLEAANEKESKEWIEEANKCYGEVSAEERKLFLDQLCAANLETPWDRAHRTEYAVERLKKNEFIHALFKRHAVPMKVTNISRNLRFKQIQHRLHNPNILYMQYIRNTQTVFAIFRCYTEMMKVIDRLNCTTISGKKIVCRPSSYAEYDKACEDELNRKFRQKKMKAAKKSGKRNKKAKKSNNKYQKSAASKLAYTNNNAKQQNNAKERTKQPKLKNYISSHHLSSPAYFYPCYCVQCTKLFPYSAKN